MGRISTKKIALNGLMIALVFLATYFTRIPTPLPGGYFNLGDTLIIVAAVVLGRGSGFLAGAVGSFLADIAFGAFIFAPITFMVKGAEGYIAGVVAGTHAEEKTAGLRSAAAAAVGAAVMIAGYFIAEAYILGLFNSDFGFAAAVTELPSNLIQGGVSAVAGYLLCTLLARVNIHALLK